MRHALWLGLFAFMLLAVEVAPARADIPGPDGKATRRPWGYGAPPPGWFERNNPPPPLPESDVGLPKPPLPPIPNVTTPTPPPTPPVSAAQASSVRPEPPKRTGPFRSCGSGMGLGLAGIGAAWAMLWLGNRFAARIAKGPRSPSARG